MKPAPPETVEFARSLLEPREDYYDGRRWVMRPTTPEEAADMIEQRDQEREQALLERVHRAEHECRKAQAIAEGYRMLVLGQ